MDEKIIKRDDHRYTFRTLNPQQIDILMVPTTLTSACGGKLCVPVKHAEAIFAALEALR